MYGYENWTIKKPEHWRIDAFELWCWRRLWRVTGIARRYNQSILKEISPEHSLEGLMLKLRLQYFGRLIRRADSLEKTLTLGKIEGRRRKGQQRMRQLDGITNSMDMGLGNSGSWWWTGRPGVLRFMGWQRVRHDLVTELNWTECLIGQNLFFEFCGLYLVFYHQKKENYLKYPKIFISSILKWIHLNDTILNYNGEIIWEMLIFS